MKTIGLVVHALDGGGTQKVVTRLADFWQANHLANVIVFFYSGEDNPGLFKTVRVNKQRVADDITDHLVAADLVLDALFMHSYDAYKAALEMRSERILKLFSCIHADYYTMYYRWYSPFKNWQRSVKYRKLFNHRSIIFNSEGVKKNLLEKIGLEVQDGYVIPPSIEIARLTEQAHVSIADDLPQTFFVVVSRLSANKQIHLAFEALQSFPEEMHLVVLGDGPERERLQQQARKLGLQDRVRFYGWTDNPYPIMKKAEFVAVFSRSEGFSIVVAEAMALGVMPLALRSAGPVSILEKSFPSLLLDKSDLVSLGNKFESGNFKEYSEALKAEAAQYDIGVVAQQYLDLV
jgi:glycosyltransferase involved in cell wall biosynthesis